MKIILFAIILFTFFSFYFFGIDDFFTIQFLKENNDLLLKHVNENFFYSIFIFYLLFFILILFFLPVTSIMVVSSSYLFGTLPTIFLSIIIVTIGGLSNIFILKKLTFERIFNKAKYFSEKIKNKIKGNEILYFATLRFIPIPFIIQNAILTMLNITQLKFVISTVLGITPWMIIYSLAGFKLKELINLNKNITIEDILNYENFFILILFFLLIFFSTHLKKKIN
tara:strand:- start:352 stop:1026 length:675 start_codon:yes stop_codon:yes gene_type:complete